MRVGISILKDATLIGPIDYPEEMPIPRFGETVHVRGFFLENQLPKGIQEFLTVNNIIYFCDEVMIQLSNKRSDEVDFATRFEENYTKLK